LLHPVVLAILIERELPDEVDRVRLRFTEPVDPNLIEDGVVPDSVDGLPGELLENSIDNIWICASRRTRATLSISFKVGSA
jgi:hypothetical protein